MSSRSMANNRRVLIDKLPQNTTSDVSIKRCLAQSIKYISCFLYIDSVSWNHLDDVRPAGLVFFSSCFETQRFYLQ